MSGLTLAAAAAAALLATTASTSANATLQTRPVVGIYSAPYHNTSVPGCSGGCDYVAASYVKWLESAGAQSLPIPFGSTDAEVAAIFPQINGVLFPGGGADLPSGARYLFQLSYEAN